MRRFVRYLAAICVGVAGTMAWQAYGEGAKRIIATRAPELGWSPEVRETIAGWTKPLAAPKKTAARPPVQETQDPARVAVAQTPATPSFDPDQAKQMAQSLDGLRQTVERLAAAQEEIGREMTKLAANEEILAKITPAPPPLSPPAAPTRKPVAAGPPQRPPR